MTMLLESHLGAEYAGHNTLHSPALVAGNASFLLIESTAYFVYIGTFRQIIRPKYVRFHVGVVAGASTPSEVAVATTPLAAYGANQTLTILEANATLDSLTSTGEKGNASAFTIVSSGIAPGVHIWAAVRTAITTGSGAEPTLSGAYPGNAARRFLLTVAGASALATDATLSGVVPSFSTSAVAPVLYLAET